MANAEAEREAKTLRILGTRCVPAAHGGFETFAEQLALHLAARGWQVVVYCQQAGSGRSHEDSWRQVRRVHIPVRSTGPQSTVVFDWKATWHAAKTPGLCLTLGYNTAAFCALLRLRGRTNLINMDGIEWSRAKWGPIPKAWLWFNDWAGCWLGNHLIADHPLIKAHLESRVDARKITTIPYGAAAIFVAPTEPLREFGLVPGQYVSVVARPEPENSLLEIVKGFSARRRDHQLLVLGNYDEGHAYHRAVKRAAGDEVRFIGAIYDKAVVQALRFHSLAYVHGHQVGGTNPSLVEALGAGNAIVAHDNRFNRWVAGPRARYFSTAEQFDALVGELLSDPAELQAMRSASRQRFEEQFTWGHILGDYEALLDKWNGRRASSFRPADRNRPTPP